MRYMFNEYNSNKEYFQSFCLLMKGLKTLLFLYKYDKRHEIHEIFYGIYRITYMLLLETHRELHISDNRVY